MRTAKPQAARYTITRHRYAARGPKLLRSVLGPEAEDRAAWFEIPEAGCVIAYAVDDRVGDVAGDDRADQAREVALRHPRGRVARELLRFRQRQPARALRDAGVARVVLRCDRADAHARHL